MFQLISYINGEYIAGSKGISLFDLGLCRGYGLFEYTRTYSGIPFYLEKHLQRLKEGARTLELQLPLTDEEISSIIKTLMQKNRLEEAGIKFIITGGNSFDLTLSQIPTFAITTYPLTQSPSIWWEKGVSIITQQEEIFLPHVKTLNYLPAILALKKARKQNAFDVLFYDDKQKISELTTSNFFAFKKGTLITPSHKILEGVTKWVVVQLAKEHFPIEERDIHLQELKEIDEAFLTASNKEILPITSIDSLNVGNGKVGPKTEELIKLFKQHAQEYQGSPLCL